LTAGLDYLLMGGARGTRSLTWRQIEDGAQQIKKKGGEAAQVVARTGAIFCGAPVNEAGQASNTAGLDYLLMGGARGTRSLTWRQIEDGAQQKKKKGRKKGGEAAQVVARNGAVFCGAPVNEEGRASNAAGFLFAVAGGWERCAGKSWAWIEAEGTRCRKKGQKAGNIASVAADHQAALVEHHLHICKSPLCVWGCTPTINDRGQVRMTHTCMDPSNPTQRDGLGLHMCRQCHQPGKVCKNSGMQVQPVQNAKDRVQPPPHVKDACAR